MVTEVGVVPDDGLTESQFPLLFVEVVAVNVRLEVPELEMDTCWLWGTVEPISKFSDTLAGVATMGEDPDEFTFRITGTVEELLPDVMVMNPA